MPIYSIRDEVRRLLGLFENEEVAKESVKLSYSKFPDPKDSFGAVVEFERERVVPAGRITGIGTGAVRTVTSYLFNTKSFL